mmetsp:Transcript_42053/g.67606  ORF Transcript_42053/g.67606 Transcript_42053/m.67606 type:complete len:150 (+) Transcript_42053:56-505(+)
MSMSSCRCTVCLTELHSESERKKRKCHGCTNKKAEPSTALASVALITFGAAVGFVGGYLYSLWNGDDEEKTQDPNLKTKQRTDDDVIDTASYSPDDEIASCPICYDHRVNVALTPCGHTLCRACSEELPNKVCPMCSKAISSTHHIFIN